MTTHGFALAAAARGIGSRFWPRTVANVGVPGGATGDGGLRGRTGRPGRGMGNVVMGGGLQVTSGRQPNLFSSKFRSECTAPAREG